VSGLHGDLRRHATAVLETLLPHFKRMELAGGETLYRSGDPSDALYVLCSGSLGAFGPSLSTDQERLLGVIAPGETVGELGLLAR
jgi:NTE family protein